MTDREGYKGSTPIPGEPPPESKTTPDEIEREIEQTRGRMSRDIDELGERLSPQNLKEQAKEVITEKAQAVVESVGAQARYSGSRLVTFIQENPSLVAAMGLGAVWLIQQRNRSEVSGDRMARFAHTGPERRGRGLRSRIEQQTGAVRHGVTAGVESVAQRVGDVREQAEEMADRARERMGELGEQASEGVRRLGDRLREQTQRTRGRLDRAMDEKPLALVAGAVVLGLAIGLVVPESRRERRIMGPTRDQLMKRVEHTAGRLKDAAIEEGAEVREAVREAVASRGPELKATLKGAAESVGQQIKESAERVKDETEEAAKEEPRSRGGERA